MQIIEAPSAPTISFDEIEKEQKKQEEIEKNVLKQIQVSKIVQKLLVVFYGKNFCISKKKDKLIFGFQAFGESANDEFDVRWAQDSLNKTLSASEAAQKQEVILLR